MNYLRMFNYVKFSCDLKNDADLARKLELSKSYISELKNNKKNMTMETFMKICKKSMIKKEYLITLLGG